MRRINRRRFIAISAAAAGCTLVPFAPAAVATKLVSWRGRALGAEASLTIHHNDRTTAEQLVRHVVAEVERLEAIFSLYRSDSTLSELNRSGALAAPPRELVAVLEACQETWELTEGAFDPTIQPLWMAFADHFSHPDADPDGPAPSRLRQAMALVGFDKVVFNRDRVAMSRRGMALTLNGVAQGYITDRVVDVLRRGGIQRSMVNLGEIRALGSRADGKPWRVGLEETSGSPRMAVLELEDKAVATSSASGFRFDAAGRFSHLIDPHSGATDGRHASVSVVALTATTADAFSTAFNLMPREAIVKTIAKRPEVQVHLVDGAGTSITL